MNTEYVLQVYFIGAGWLDFGVYYDKNEAFAALADRQARGDRARVINGDAEDEAIFNASLELV